MCEVKVERRCPIFIEDKGALRENCGSCGHWVWNGRCSVESIVIVAMAEQGRLRKIREAGLIQKTKGAVTHGKRKDRKGRRQGRKQAN